MFRKRVCYLTQTGTLTREKRVEILANRRGRQTSGLTQGLWSKNKHHKSVTVDQSRSVLDLHPSWQPARVIKLACHHTMVRVT